MALSKEQMEIIVSARDDTAQAFNSVKSNLTSLEQATRAQNAALREMSANSRGAAQASTESGATFKNVAEGSLIAAKAVATLGTAYFAWRGFSTALTALRVGGPVLMGLSVANALYQRGAVLVEEYANAHRKLDRSDLAGGLSALTKLQGDTITAGQAQRATELGTRLADANWQIEKFLKVQLDLVDPALKLQAVWVNVVELVAAATGKADLLIDKMSKMPGAGIAGTALLQTIPGVGAGYAAYRAANYYNPEPPAPTADQSMAAARGRAAAALEVASISRDGADGVQEFQTFAGKFGAIGYDLKKMLDGLSTSTKDQTKNASEARTAWDRAIDTARKHVAVQEAEVAAVGKGVGAQAQYRMEAQLLEAGLRAGMTPELVKASEEFQKLTERARASAVALGEARLKSDLNFEGSQIGRSDTEQKVASQLRGIYGDNYVNEMDGAIAAQIRFNEALRTGKDLATDFATGFTRDFVSGLRAGESAWDSFAKAGESALNRLADKLIDMAVQNLVANAFGGIANSGFFGIGVGSGSQSVPVIGAAGGLAVPTFMHDGGIVGVNGSRRGFVHAAYFENAPRMHSGGLAGLAHDEVPAILQRGERVIPKGGGGGAPIINNISVKGDGVTASVSRSSRNSSGGVDLEVVINGAVKTGMAAGEFDGVLSSRTGGRPPQVRR